MFIKFLLRSYLKFFRIAYILPLILILNFSACGSSNNAAQIFQESGPDIAMYISGVFEAPEIWQQDCPETCPANRYAPCPANDCPDTSPEKCKAKVYPREEKNRHAQRIASSGLTTLIHMFLHFYPDGSLVLNNTALVYPDGTINMDIVYLKDLYRQVKASGRVKILLSIGGWHTSDYTFSRILASMKVYPDIATNPYFRNLLIAKQFFQFDGIDLDFEPDWTVNFIHYDDTYATLLADITRWATANGMIVTYGAYKEIDFWKKALLKTMGDNNRQLVTRLYIQFYDGGRDNVYQDWFDGLTDKNYGIANIDHFISVGHDCSKSLSGIQNALADIKNGYSNYPPHPEFQSGFMYQYENIVSCKCATSNPEDYVQAITKGVKGIKSIP